MSHLVQLRQRITATQITQKTTNAMRLIAMSTHTRLRNIKGLFDDYKNHLHRLLDTLKALSSDTITTRAARVNDHKTELVIIIGSQKGLCGNFNTSMAEYFQKNPPLHTSPQINTYTIAVGKQLKNTLLAKSISTDFAFDQLNSSNYRSIAQELSSYVLSNKYGSIIFYYTYPKSFFTATHIHLPLTMSQFSPPTTNEASLQHFGEQSYSQTYSTLGILTLKATIEGILIDSLLAEQAARFLSMDTATRNAEDLIVRMKLDYNKVRQAAITRELTDLSGSFTR